MRVLHVIPSVAKVRGGPSQAILEEVQALAAQSIDVEIATTNDNGPALLDVPLNQLTEYGQVPVRFFERFSPSIHSVREFALSSSLTSWLVHHARHYDLLHIHAIFSYPSTVAMAIARHQNIPYILRPVGQLCQWSLQQSAQKKRIYLDLIEKANINGAQALHFTTQKEQEEAKQLNFNPDSFILPHGLISPQPYPNARQTLRQQLNLPPDEPILLFLSRLHPKKGLEILLPALGQLRHHRFTLVLAGNGDADYTDFLKVLIDTHGLADRTHFLGFVEGEEKAQLLQGADLFTLTSHSENFGIAVLEALGAGLPALVTPGVALSSMIQQHQLGYVTTLKESDIVQTLEAYFASPRAAKLMGDRARQVVQQEYSWSNIAAKLIDIYHQCCKK